MCSSWSFGIFLRVFNLYAICLLVGQNEAMTAHRWYRKYKQYRKYKLVYGTMSDWIISCWYILNSRSTSYRNSDFQSFGACSLSTLRIAVYSPPVAICLLAKSLAKSDASRSLWTHGAQRPRHKLFQVLFFQETFFFLKIDSVAKLLMYRSHSFAPGSSPLTFQWPWVNDLTSGAEFAPMYFSTIRIRRPKS